MEDNELFGERHEQEENGLYGRKHAELCDLHNVSGSLCMNTHNWVCKKDGKILIRGSWNNRLKCNGCGDWCFVHKASDGKYYCGECRGEAIKEGAAIAW